MGHVTSFVLWFLLFLSPQIKIDIFILVFSGDYHVIGVLQTAASAYIYDKKIFRTIFRKGKEESNNNMWPLYQSKSHLIKEGTVQLLCE